MHEAVGAPQTACLKESSLPNQAATWFQLVKIRLTTTSPRAFKPRRSIRSQVSAENRLLATESHLAPFVLESLGQPEKLSLNPSTACRD